MTSTDRIGDPRADHSPRFEVVDVDDAGRYELRLDGVVVGRATYDLTGDVVTLPYVETLPEFRGRGFAERLMDGIVDDVRARGLTIRPVCWYAAGHLRDRPDTHDLVAADPPTGEG